MEIKGKEIKIDYVKWISVAIAGYVIWKGLGIRDEFRSTSSPEVRRGDHFGG